MWWEWNEKARKVHVQFTRKSQIRNNKRGQIECRPCRQMQEAGSQRRVWIFVEAWIMFSWLRRKCSTVLLGFNLSVDGENRSVIESQRLRVKKNVALSCMFVHLVSRVSEWRTWGKRRFFCRLFFCFVPKDQVLQCKHSRGEAIKGERLMAACVGLTAASPVHKSLKRGREDRVKWRKIVGKTQSRAGGLKRSE